MQSLIHCLYESSINYKSLHKFTGFFTQLDKLYQKPNKFEIGECDNKRFVFVVLR